jgi:PadR family transcriptional regulator PadR
MRTAGSGYGTSRVVVSSEQPVFRPALRITTPALVVLAVMLDGERWHGLRVMAATGMRGGTVYPVLARFEQAGWVTSAWEDKTDPAEKHDVGAPRRYYRLTPAGREAARAVLAARPKMAAQLGLT